jgi:hypothetical protein
MMAHATLRGLRSGCFLAAAAGLLTVLTGAAVRAADPPKAGDKGTEMIQVINDAIKKGWEENKITPSGPCSDYTFIRRASLDIIGRIATPTEIKEFLAQPQNTRRAWLIEKLLKGDDYPRHWAALWANWLLTRQGPFGGRSNYHEETQVWLEDQFAQNIPYSQLATKLITAKGKNTENPEVNFLLAHVGEANPQNTRGEQGQFDMVPVTSRMTRLFLGTQTQCAQCHDHPFDGRIKQQDYWGINAFLRQIERRGQPPMPNQNNQNMGRGPMLELVVNTSNNAEGYVSYEKRNGVILKTKPVFRVAAPASETGQKPSDLKADRRDELAKYIVEHPMFGKAFVNRMWGHFMGRGFVNPIDDFNEQNTPSHPELLATLGEKFAHYGYDMKNVIRWICNSQPYQLSAVANKTNDKPETEQLFSRMLLKVMSPEELFESITTATATDAGKDARRDLRTRWMQALVQNFGDDEGNEVNYNGTVVQALLMMNGRDINDAVSDGNGLVAKLMKAYKVTNNTLTPQTQAYIINDIYLATLNRPPSDTERSKIANAMTLLKPIKLPNGKETFQPVPDKEVAHRFQDLLWALINSNEFMLNH